MRPMRPAVLYGSALVALGALVTTACGGDRPHADARPQVYSASGSVPNAEGVTIRLRGPEARTVTTGPRGAWTIPALRPGTYVVTPTQPGFVFEPRENEFTIRDSDVTAITFVRRQPAEGLSPADAARLDSIPDIWPPSDSAGGPPVPRTPDE